MNYGEVKTYLRTLINRSDVTDTLADQFLQQAQDRLERLLRTSFMQRFVNFTLDGTSGDFRIPTDYLEHIGMFTDYGLIRRVDLTEFLRTTNGPGTPEVFIQTGHTFRMRPYPDADTQIYLNYYGTEPELENDASENYWTLSSVDAFCYAAAALAGDYFEDERLARFEDKFQSALAELRDQQTGEDMSGSMVVAPAYRFPSDT